MPKYSTVAELLESPERWTQGAYARDASGARVDYHDANACSWDVPGAIVAVYGGVTVHMAERAREKLYAVIGYADSIGHWNDDLGRTHAEVLEAVRKAGI